MQTAYINRVATAVPPYDVHDAFRRFAQSLLNDDRRNSLLFQRMADKSGIEHRYSCLSPSNLLEGDRVDTKGFYACGDFPNTAVRMRRFEQHAPALAQAAVDRLQLRSGVRPHHPSADNLLHRFLRTRPRSRTHRAL